MARAVDGVQALQFQVFEMGGEGPAHAGTHGVSTFTKIFGDDVACVVYHIGVVATATGELVAAAATVQGIVRLVADQLVVQVVAGAIEIFIAEQCEFFYMVAEGVADTGAHQVVPLVGLLNDLVEHVVNVIGVVARIPRHGVLALAPHQGVGAEVAAQVVGQFIAVATEVGTAHQGQVLKMVGESEVVQAGANGVCALVGRFLNVVGEVVHLIGVVPLQAPQGVGAKPAHEGVVAAVAGDAVGVIVAGAGDISGPRQGQVFNMGAEGVVGCGQDDVIALGGRLNHDVGLVIDLIDVVAASAFHLVGAFAALQAVVAAVTQELIGEVVARQGEVAGAGDL